MTKIIDPQGTEKQLAPKGPRRTVTDITGAKITPGMRDDLPPGDPLSLDDGQDVLPSFGDSSPSNPLPPTLPPNPGIFRLQETPRANTVPVTGMSQIVEKVRHVGTDSPFVTPPSENIRRLSHNEMLEEVVGSRDLSNQTKFYLIAKMGIQEEEHTVVPPVRASTEVSEVVSKPSQPRKKNPQKGNPDAI